MKNGYRFILYSFIILLVLGGLALFIFRDSFIDSWREQSGLTELATGTKFAVTARDTLDPEILKSPKFTSLTNYVTDFNFDNICQRPDVVVSQPEIPAEVASSTASTTDETASTTPMACHQGNSSPFLEAKKK